MKKSAFLTDKKTGLRVQVKDSFQKARKELDELVRAVEIVSTL